jgi:hypothetical protein
MKKFTILLFCSLVFVVTGVNAQALSVVMKTPTETGVAINSPVFVIFNVPIEDRFTSDTWISIVPEVTIFSVEANENILNITHANFQYDITYTVTIKKEAIEGLTEDIVWSFITGAQTALVSIQEVTPHENDTNASVDEKVTVTFDVPVTGSSLAGITIKAGSETVNVTGTLDETNKILTIDYTLAPNTTYTVTVPRTAIKGLTSDKIWSFTTAPEPPLTWVSTTPVNEAQNVGLDVEIVITFNKNIKLVDTSNKDYFSPSVEVSTVGNSDDQLIITHAGFEPGTTYTVTIPAGMVEDYDEEITWTFTTKDTPITGIEIMDRLEARLYPNPVIAGEEFTVQVEQYGNNRLTVEIFTASGVLLQKTGTTGTLFHMSAPNVAGIYLMRITGNNTAVTCRLVVQ